MGEGIWSQEAKLSTLQKVFGLGTKEAEDVTITVQTKAYRNHLRRAVQDGTLDAAESKAAFLTVPASARNLQPLPPSQARAFDRAQSIPTQRGRIF